MEENGRSAASAYKDARALVDKLKARPQSAAQLGRRNDGLIQQIEAIAPASAAVAAESGGGRAGGGGFGALAEPPPPPNLANIGAQMVASVMAMQGSEMPPTLVQLQACSRQEAAYTALMAKWTALKSKVNSPAAPAGRGGGKQ
jgi:hypothetical protein